MPGGTNDTTGASEDASAENAAGLARNVTNQDDPDESELPAEQALCVQLALEGKSQQEIADYIGYSRRQVIRWMARKQVRDAIRQGAQEGLFRARMVLSTNASRAASSLVGMAAGLGEEGGKTPDQAQIAAAKAVIELATKLGEYAGDAAATKHDVHVGGGLSVAQMNSEQRAKRRAELDAKVRAAREKASRSTGGDQPDGSGGSTA